MVDLSNNQLTSVPGELVSKCPKLDALFLSNNQLTSVPGEAGKQMPKVKVVRH